MRKNYPDNVPRRQQMAVLVGRCITALRSLGVTVHSDYQPGDTEPAVYSVLPDDRLFR